MYTELFEALPDALLLVDRAGDILRANAQAERLFGYPGGGLLGLPVEQLLPEGMRARHRIHRAEYDAAPRVRAMGESGMALVGQRRDGRQFPLEVALSPLMLNGDTCVLASVRDISETHRARQSLVRARYDALLARIGQAALESTTEHALVSSLPSLLSDVLGVDQVIALLRRGQQPAQLHSAIPVNDEEAVLLMGEGLALVTAGEGIVIADRTLESQPFPLPRSEGSGAAFPLLDRGQVMGLLLAWSAEPNRFEHDALHLLHSVATLISALVQRQRAEEQLAHAQRLDAIGQLTGGIAHDFNNLLTVVSGSLQLLEADCDDPAHAELIDMALHATEGGAELTGKLLAFGRRQLLNPTALVPDQVLPGLAVMFQRTLGDSIRLATRIAPGTPAAHADRAQLEAALLNLALNARDAMPDGGELTLAAEERWVSIAESRLGVPAGHYTVFSVSDKGAGMAPEVRARAVEPFFTTKGAGRGSGLGLSMVYGFVAQSGGHLHIESAPGKGTRVELYLPSRPEPVVEVIRHAEPLPEASGERVLLLEDDPAVMAIASAFVVDLGYRVTAAATPEEALAALEADDGIALLFTDVMLGPGRNGKDVATLARARRPGLAVLLTTGYEAAPEADADDVPGVLRKPYTRERLGEALRRALAGRATDQQDSAARSRIGSSSRISRRATEINPRA